MSVGFTPINFFVNLSIELSTCFLRRHAWEYFVFLFFFGCVGQIGFGLDVWLGSQLVDGSASVLKFFFRLHNSTSCRPLLMMSFFIYWYFEHDWTDWDSQYLSWEEVYCATTALDGYPSHVKIHYIQDGDLCLYMWHHLLQTLAINTPNLITPIHLLMANICFCPS